MSKKRRLVRVAWSISGQAYGFALDAATNETHRLSADVTEHPVERGADLADHIRKKPDELTIEGLVSNTPLYLPPDHTDGAREIRVPIKGAAVTIGSLVGRPVPLVGSLVSKIPLPLPAETGVAKGFDPEFDRCAAVWEEIRALFEASTTVSVETTLHQYETMALQGAACVRNADSGNALVLTLEFKAIHSGSTKTVAVPASPIARVAKAVKAVTEVEDPPVNQSELDALFEGREE